MLEGKSNTLTLTFVNALVEDLSLELCGISNVNTLHSFALSVLSKKGTHVRVFPKLSRVIAQDAQVLLQKKIDFDYLFHNREDGSEFVEFYRQRRQYYGYYGFSDIVFAAAKYFEQNKEKIPKFEQVVVDEFQDFNALEVSLIDLLAEKSPILLAGDDDQALYESLKSASPAHIRQRYGDAKYGYIGFALPYCSRCTRVVVDAANDIVSGAKKDGHIEKKYQRPSVL